MLAYNVLQRHHQHLLIAYPWLSTEESLPERASSEHVLYIPYGGNVPRWVCPRPAQPSYTDVISPLLLISTSSLSNISACHNNM